MPHDSGSGDGLQCSYSLGIGGIGLQRVGGSTSELSY
jgi:hypothetical protein